MRATFVLLLLALGVVPATAEAIVTVRVSHEATVTRDRVSLGEVAEIDGDEPLASRIRALEFGPAPAAGATERLDAAVLRVRLRGIWLDTAHVRVIVPSELTLTRAFQVISGTALVDAVRRELLARRDGTTPLDPATLSLVPVQAPEDLRVPTGDVALDAQLQQGPPGSIFLAATVAVRVGGREQRRLSMTFRVGHYKTVAIAAHQLDPGSVLTSRDVRLESRPSTEIPSDALLDAKDVSDLEAVRTIASGQVLSQTLLRRKVVLKRGEPVTLVVETPRLKVTTLGQALEDAHRGDATRVLNVTSKREVIGHVERGGIVTVPFAELGGQP